MAPKALGLIKEIARVCIQVLSDEEAAPEKAALLVMLLDRRWVEPFAALFNAHAGSVPGFLRKVTTN